MIGTFWDDLAAPEPWTADAVCQQTDPEAFFPGSGESSRRAKAVCLNCPVTEECLAYALREDIPFGIWGGLSRGERRRMLRARPEATP